MKTAERYTNLCRTCGEDFGSVSAFDAHRVGRHDYLYAPSTRPDGRRCLDIEEMEASEGFARNSYGRWSLPGDLGRARGLREHEYGSPRGVSDALRNTRMTRDKANNSTASPSPSALSAARATKHEPDASSSAVLVGF